MDAWDKYETAENRVKRWLDEPGFWKYREIRSDIYDLIQAHRDLVDDMRRKQEKSEG